MNHDPRPHIRRRRLALDRHRSLSTTVAVAGIAGTAGFGAIAALSWSGDPAATPLPVSGDDGGAVATTPPRTSTRVQPAAPNGGFAQPPTVTTTRPRTSGHASTGGSHG